MSGRTKPTKRRPQTYTIIDALMASPSEPIDADKRTHQLNNMWAGLSSIETGSAPTVNDWRVLSDAVNMLETMIVAMLVCEDQDGLLQDAITALAAAGERHRKTGIMRLDGPGLHAVRSVLEDYSDLLEVLPARTVIQAHRLTERRIQNILARKQQPHDVVVMAL